MTSAVERIEEIGRAWRLQSECRRMQAQPATDFNRGVADKVADDIEYWQIDKALDLMKPLVGRDDVGLARQIKQYRDWVAHRNPRKKTPAKIDPESAEAILTRLAAALESN